MTDPTLTQTESWRRYTEARAIDAHDTAQAVTWQLGTVAEGSPEWVEAVERTALAWQDAATRARELRTARAHLSRQLDLATMHTTTTTR